MKSSINCPDRHSGRQTDRLDRKTAGLVNFPLCPPPVTATGVATDRQTAGKQTDRWAERKKKGRQTDTERQADRQAGRQTDRKLNGVGHSPFDLPHHRIWRSDR